MPDVVVLVVHGAEQVETFAPDHVNVEAEPTRTEVGLAVRVRDGVVGGGGGEPPPFRAYWVAAFNIGQSTPGSMPLVPLPLKGLLGDNE